MPFGTVGNEHISSSRPVSSAGPHLTFLNTPDGVFSQIPFLEIVQYFTFYPHTAGFTASNSPEFLQEIKTTNDSLFNISIVSVLRIRLN